MTALTIGTIQQRYRKNKTLHGWKRVQIWVRDETNEDVKKRVKQGAFIANHSASEKTLLADIKEYNQRLLEDVPL